MGLTPMMRQYIEIKETYEDCILFFRLGDFYEMFFDDALTCSKLLEITLTGKSCGLEERAPMCGIPYHAAENYIRKLINFGLKVAICEQIGDPKQATGIVKREVVKIITPGTITEPDMLDSSLNNYILSISEGKNRIGFSYVDITTGELRVTSFKGISRYKTAENELIKIFPREILIVASSLSIKMADFIHSAMPQVLTTDVGIQDDYDDANKTIQRQFKIMSLDSLGLNTEKEIVLSLGCLIDYVIETQKVDLPHIRKVKHYNPSDFMIIDDFTARNLELSKTIMGDKKKGSLLWVLDKTKTSMGSRLLVKWINEPLLNHDEIETRLSIVDVFFKDLKTSDDVREILETIYDLERLTSKVVYGNLNGRDLISLKVSLKKIPELKDILCKHSTSIPLSALNESLDSLGDVYELIEAAIAENPPITITEGGIIKSTYNEELLSLVDILSNGKSWIRSIETRERESTGIKSLKIKFNKVFGYYIEITKSNLEMVPDEYIRKQTLVNAERYITPELKELEDKIINAEERKNHLEYEIFQSVREDILKNVDRLLNTAEALSHIDVLSTFANVAYHNGYSKPEVNSSDRIYIENGRHPVVEKFSNIETFIPNNTELDNNHNRFHIITGPNMAGKSTYLRQVALITLMAQIGSFIPADNAVIGIVDRIFTRVGASDNLSQGQSTFMVEMSELSNILTNATRKSLIILDEIGRGTSTYDGLSIAWSVVEYINSQKHIGAKSLFATHYHELTELEGKLEGIKNYFITVKEIGDDIIFLRKIKLGGANHSYGVQVAKLAGLPYKVVSRASEILAELESHDINKNFVATEADLPKQDKELRQLDFFSDERRQFIEMVTKIDTNYLTPIEALNILNHLVEESEKL
ncbi:MAG: DNA mismatch repair protein MutS [Peptostreptococcaceae bacterium]|nr:DNA mismatch repair protein MutS [Peptostreptococcaceae bacterium]